MYLVFRESTNSELALFIFLDHVQISSNFLLSRVSLFVEKGKHGKYLFLLLLPQYEYNFFKSRLTSSWENFNCCRFRSSRFAVLAVLFSDSIAYNEKEDCFIHTLNKPSFSQSQRSFDLVSLSLLPFHTYPKQNVFLLGHTVPLI